MKLTLIGGGGMRAPLVVEAALQRAQRIHLDELCLLDNDPEQLEVMGEISRLIAERSQVKVKLTATANTQAALEGASYVITTTRVGKEKGRILDERIALKHGVLGQETTGPGGFAMAMRSIPSILEYAAWMTKLNLQAWMFNFTNPAGLVTQALRDSGFRRTVGICDGANQAQHAVASYLGIPPLQVQTKVFGLNHLSWARRAWVNGADVLSGLLADARFLASCEMQVFDYELVCQVGMWMNEYLYYYHYAHRAVKSILSEGITRGEEILTLNQILFKELRRALSRNDATEALRIYRAYNERRSATYMHYARKEAPSIEEASEKVFSGKPDEQDSEGYAGVALDIIAAMESGEPLHIALNVPNEGAITGMKAEDVVEVSCRVDQDSIHPQPIGEIPAAQAILMQSVKYYERLAVKAILARSRVQAAMALMAHPLVLSFPLAKTLVEEYIQAHADHICDWGE